MILHGIGDEIDSRLSGSDNLSSPHIDSLIIISFLPARYMTLHVKCDEIDSGRHAWWDRHPIFTVHVAWIVGRVSGTCQRLISRVKTPTSCQRKNMFIIASIWLVKIFRLFVLGHINIYIHVYSNSLIQQNT